MHLLARPGIQTIAGLRGKRVAIGEPGSGTTVTALTLLHLAGVKPRDVQTLEATRALDALKKGEIDALFDVVGAPVRRLVEQVSAGDRLSLLTIRLQPHPDDAALAAVYVPATIPAGTYPWQERPVETVTVKSGVVTSGTVRCEAIGAFARARRGSSGLAAPERPPQVAERQPGPGTDPGPSAAVALRGDAAAPVSIKPALLAPARRWLLVGLGLILAACAGPVQAIRVDPKVVLGELARSAITTGEPSLPTRNVLFELGLFDMFAERPEAALAELHRAMVASRGDPNLLFGLAELSFLHGQTARKREHQLAAVVYAYAFLFPEGAGVAPGRFDLRVRLAAELYNWGLVAWFMSEDGAEVNLRGGKFALPFGSIEVAFDPGSLRAGDRELYRLVPAAELHVEGLAMRYRWAGLGAPLAASNRLIDASRPGRDMVAPRLQVPLTALLRIPYRPGAP